MAAGTRFDRTHVLALVVAVTAVTLVVALTQLSVSPRRLSVGTIVVASTLLVGSIAVPALLLAAWHDETA